MAMTVYVALLRAVNVAGHHPVSMPQLADAFVRLGFTGVQTILQSGNVVFRGPAEARAALEARLERQIARELDVRTNVIVRTAAEWSVVLEGNPFPAEAQQDPARLLAIFLKSPPPPEGPATLAHAIRGPELARVVGDVAFLVYPNGIGRSPVTTALIERSLETRGTARNWNTVRKLYGQTRP